jgi:glycosyltransferase involved in cell wall biosynthesis
MHVGIDLTPLLPVQTGVDTFIREIVPAVVTLDRSVRFSLFVNREDLALFEGRFAANVQLRPWCVRGRAVRGVFQQLIFPVACRALRIDVLHSPSFVSPLIRGGARHIVTIHDMTFFTMPGLHLPFHRSASFRRAVKLSAHRSDLIQVPSEDTRRGVLLEWPAIAPERVRVTPFGIASEFRPIAKGEDLSEFRRRLGLPDRYVLFVGTIEPRKNVRTLVDAWRRLARDDVVLLIAGYLGWDYRELLVEIEALERAGRARRVGFVSHMDLPQLYRAAELFVYPSLYEGFGFPPLEALASGVPVIASEGSALDDNLSGAAELVPPTDVEALADAICRLLAEAPAERERRIARGLVRAADFTWRRTAELLLECYRDLVPSSRSERREIS